ncbi:unnamed protein product [Oikopleura dioica]|uniref:Uncharacterized protein n=1 Tax=Oikopleura dioica TaxID=34765 RepID=E4Z1S0_OIKDI|nr:unnamed protein product [Oikopleura dioica]
MKYATWGYNRCSTDKNTQTEELRSENERQERQESGEDKADSDEYVYISPEEAFKAAWKRQNAAERPERAAVKPIKINQQQDGIRKRLRIQQN